MKRRRIWILLGAVLVLVLAGGALMKMKSGPKGARVRTQKIERGRLVATVTANGKIQARKKVEISANVPGQIVNLAVREGDRVKKGDFLLQIDRTNLQAQSDSSKAALDALFHDRDSARASVAQARLDADRARILFDSGLIARSDHDRANTTLDQAEASLEAVEKRIDQARATFVGARDTLGKTTMRAPIDGIVTRLAVEEGEVAVIGTMNNPGTVLLTISDLAEIEAVMEVDETDIPNIRTGQKAAVRIDAYPNREFGGTVTEVGSSPIQTASAASSEAIDFEVKVRLNEPPAGLKPGLTCSATITTGEKDGVLFVPLQALVIREKEQGKTAGARPKDQEGVFVIEGGKVRFAPIESGMTGELDIEVASGLKGGEEIVQGPFRTLRDLKDGDAVLVDNSLPRAGEGQGP